jgi:hypothetical protein
MRSMVRILVLALGLVSAGAQETLNFVVYLYGANVVPPADSQCSASGLFTLDGDVLNYTVGMRTCFTPAGAGLYGPAAPGANGPVVFDWPDYLIFLPDHHGNPGGVGYAGGYILSPEQIEQLKAGHWYIVIKSERFPEGELRGQICPVSPGSDCDFDGVPNANDSCDGTNSVDVVDTEGCSIEQLCPCSGPWANHREYVRCVREQAFRFWREKRINVAERNAIIKAAEKSSCGTPLSPPGLPIPGGAFPGPAVPTSK